MPSTMHYSARELTNNPKMTQRINDLTAERRKATEEQRKEIEARLIDIIIAAPSELYYTDPATGLARIRQPWLLSKNRAAVFI